MNRTGMTKVKLSNARVNYLRVEMMLYPDTKSKLENFQFTLTSREIIYLQQIVNALEQALCDLEITFNGIKKREAIEDLYWKSKYRTVAGVAMNYEIHDNTLRAWDQEFLTFFAMRLGLKV